MKGWVYVKRGSPGPSQGRLLVQDPKVRAAELDLAGLPHPHVVAYEVLVEEPQPVEKTAHQLLKAHHHRKEFFQCNLAIVVETTREVVGGRAILEELHEPLAPDARIDFRVLTGIRRECIRDKLDVRAHG